jgi:crotonobetainyl-CoA:carnitine CoA-transferase CaiB-like acyl-CoA transferase
MTSALPQQSDATRPLGAYRVIELPGAMTLAAGKTFADLGADVIKIEPPGGDPARLLPPLAEIDGAPQGLYWQAYSYGKRSVTADFDTEEGRELARRLVSTADVVLESYTPGVLDRLGFGYDALKALNPGIVLTSITSFGQEGPYADWKGSDLVHFAMGGYLYMTGPKDGLPMKPSMPYQSWQFGCQHAVAGTLLALRRRKKTGIGAHVDEAVRDTGLWMLSSTFAFYDLLGINLHRYGSQRDVGGAVRLPNVYPCADGYVIWLFQSGQRGKDTAALVEWMRQHGMAPDWVVETDWVEFDILEVPPEIPVRLAEIFGAFFATKTKLEFLEWAVTSGVMLAPVQSLDDLLRDRQLESRATWRTMAVDGREGPIKIPGPPIRLSAATWEPRGPAPAAGEHNDAVLGELGLDVGGLRSRGIV